MKDMLEERRKALENVFFEKYNRKLLEQMREKHQHELDRDQLAKVDLRKRGKLDWKPALLEQRGLLANEVCQPLRLRQVASSNAQ